MIKLCAIKKNTGTYVPVLTFLVHIIYTKVVQSIVSIHIHFQKGIEFQRKDFKKGFQEKISEKGDYVYPSSILWVHIVSKE